MQTSLFMCETGSVASSGKLLQVFNVLDQNILPGEQNRKHLHHGLEIVSLHQDHMMLCLQSLFWFKSLPFEDVFVGNAFLYCIS